MTLLYRGVSAQDVADAYRAYAQLLIDRNIGTETTTAASKITLPGGLAEKMAAATSIEALVSAAQEASRFTSRTERLAKHFALRDEGARKSYAIIRLMEGFNTPIVNYNLVDEEEKNYLNDRVNSKTIFDKLPIGTDYNAEAVLPSRGGIWISFADASEEAVGWEKRREDGEKLQRTVLQVLRESPDVVFMHDFHGAYFRPGMVVALRHASDLVFKCLESNAAKLSDRPLTIQWAEPGLW